MKVTIVSRECMFGNTDLAVHFPCKHRIDIMVLTT